MIHLGDRLGLYGALAAADGPLTTTELADRTGLDERWVREWAYNQAAAKLIAVDADADGPNASRSHRRPRRCSPTPDHPAFGMGMFHRFPQTMAALELMPESFRTGLGHDYDSHGPEGAVGIERSFEPWNRHHLIPTVLPALDGIVERLRGGDHGRRRRLRRRGSGAADGRSVPAQHASWATTSRSTRSSGQNIADARTTQPTCAFVDPRVEPLPDDHSVDFVTTFDCIHDMTHPQQMIDAIGAALAPRGHVAARRHQGP